jgi:hypothetical protein
MPDPKKTRQLTLDFGDEELKCCEHKHCTKTSSEQVCMKQSYQDACEDLQEEDK